ncbi:LysR family transcriptional regulator [Caenimonas aquaedulcis]|uniref:LysR family transcriptional regulator n=1 Tax=Caenimonas aquaedulcis TaxID=2793270 RepID=A0A931H6A4_9BURK|nr:LysR family transcriptional regulator [Caenimonas aquaedulcis]MBG9389247.1 LysR family transcriptional regulator [Caenimonas aquaedulcis]
MKSSIASTQYTLTASDLDVLLALVRGGTLAGAASRIHADASTVFRSVQRIERQLGQRLFERTRQGYLPSETMLEIAGHAERIESELELARAAALSPNQEVIGRVRVTTVDAVLRGLVLPCMASLAARHASLQLELRTTNELMSLSRRDADLALRAIIPASKPPGHLVGRHLGAIRFVACASRAMPTAHRKRALDAHPWIAPDDALPDHPSVRWRRKHLAKAVPRVLVDDDVNVLDAIKAGAGVGVVPLFLLAQEPQLVALTGPLEDCESQLWLLAHPESRHLRRIAAVYQHLVEHIALP